MSDFKNALDSYKKSSGKKTVNSGFSAGKIPSSDKKNKDMNNSLPEHLKKSLSDSDENEKTAVNSRKRKADQFSAVNPEKFVFNQFDEKAKDSGHFIKETGQNVPAADKLSTVSASEKSGDSKKTDIYTDSGIRRVAKLLALLGKDEAANVLKSFSPAEIERIAAELLKIRQIGRDEASELLKIIHKKNTKTEIFTGGVDKAREILIQAYGRDKGEEILKKSLPEKREKPFEFLNDIEAMQIKLILKNESPMITAIILSHLLPEKSASLLNEYSDKEKKELILKMSQKGRISRGIVEKIENGLKEKIREQGKVVSREIDGKNRLAGILRFMDPEEEERILEELTEEDPDLSREIDSKIFSIDIIHDIPDRDFQKILNDFSENEIAMILKGRSGKIKKKFAKNLSQQRKELVHRESEFIGIVRKSEVNKSTTEFLDYIRQFEKDGKIIINRGGNLFV